MNYIQRRRKRQKRYAELMRMHHKPGQVFVCIEVDYEAKTVTYEWRWPDELKRPTPE